jgi:hypothetical protein
MQRKIAISVAAVAALLAGSYVWAQGRTSPSAHVLPWGQTADEVAWQSFAQIMAPSGNPQTKDVEFETWASDEDIYTATPQWPVQGPNAPSKAKRLHQSVLGAAGRLEHGFTVQVIDPSQCIVSYSIPAANAVKFPSGACIGEEVRRNWASYQYIVSNGLNTKAGMATAYRNGLEVSLPADSIEFKANWVKVPDLIQWLKNNNVVGRPTTAAQVAKQYYVNQGFALVSFHFFTKQIKDWVWTDFEHEFNPGRCDFIGCHDSYGATIANVAPKPLLNQHYGRCAKSAKVQAIFTNAGLSDVWNHYCLKGTQINFTNPRRLGNSIIEAVNAGVPIENSSCISCHFYASFDKDGKPNGAALRKFPVGPANPAWMKGYRSNDFVWGLLFAPSTPPPAPH